MVSKAQILQALTRTRLIDLAACFGVRGLTGYAKDDLVATLSSMRTTKAQWLECLPRDELEATCRAVGLDVYGRERQLLIDRLLGREHGPAETRNTERQHQAVPIPPAAPTAFAKTHAGSKASRPSATPTTPGARTPRPWR